MRRAIAALVLLAAIGAIYVFGKRAYWDYQVKRLCEEDGGHTVYEVAEIPPSQYELFRDAFGHYVVRPAEYSGGAPIVRRTTETIIHTWNPRVRRYEQSAVRLSDGKVLAKYVSYSRVGGDLIALHNSYFSCPNVPALPIESVVVVKE